MVLLASLEVEIRGLQRQLVTSTLGTEEGRADALKVQGKIQGLMRAQDLMIDLGNGDENVQVDDADESDPTGP